MEKKRKIQITDVQEPRKICMKTPDAPYQVYSMLLETDKILLFKSKNYNTCLSIGLNSLRMLHIFRPSDIGAGLNLVWTDVLDLNWMESIRPPNIPDIQRASDAKLTVSWNMAFHFTNGESCIRVTIVVVDILAISVLSETTVIDRHMKSVDPSERKIVLYYSSSVLILTEHEARCVAEKEKDSYIRRSDTEEVGLLVAPIESNSGPISIAQ